MGARWYIKPHDSINPGSIMLEEGRVFLCVPFKLLSVRKQRQIFVFTFYEEATKKWYVCRTTSQSFKPFCSVNKQKKKAPPALIPFCRADSLVKQIS